MTTDERITTLEARIDTLTEAHDAVNRQLAQARIDQWQSRIDELELQVHLGRLEATDRVTEMTAELQSRWSKARRQLQEATTTTAAVAGTLQTGLDKAYHELRDAVIASRKQLV
ncbi:hypothetical protein BH09ACT12_BH09ACT12_00830 [soil metagenome]